jgi:hypothetical protein
MSSFDSDSEDVRLPDEVYCERLVDDFPERLVEDISENNDDLEIALQKSIEEYLIPQSENNNSDDEYEKIIHQSIIDECERIEKIKEEEKRIMNENENKIFISKKEEKYKYFISKLTYIIGNETKRNQITSIIKKYINTTMDKKYIFITNTEYDLFNKFMNYIYVIPKIQNRRCPVNKDDAEELITFIKNENIDFYYGNNDETFIKEINNYFN